MDKIESAATQHFITVALEEECSTAFTDNIDLLRLAFRACRERHPFSLTAGVILPDHLHFILALPAGDTAGAARWGLLRALLARIGGGSDVCPTFQEQPMRDETELQKHIDYIHADPVRHGLVRSPRKWQFSSLHAYVQHGLRPLHWSGDVDGRYGARVGTRNRYNAL